MDTKILPKTAYLLTVVANYLSPGIHGEVGRSFSFCADLSPAGADGSLVGIGADEFGKFSISEVQINKEGGELFFIKTYEGDRPAHRVEYTFRPFGEVYPSMWTNPYIWRGSYISLTRGQDTASACLIPIPDEFGER